MSLLLDTHVVLWILVEDGRIPAGVRKRLTAGSEPVFMSAAVLWEVAIKSGLGKLEVAADFRERIARYDFAPLPVSEQHAWAVRALAPHHRDPFDRLLIAQAVVEEATLVTADPRFTAYGVAVLWD